MRPVRKAEFRLLYLDSVMTVEITEAVAARGKVQLDDIRVGPLRPNRGGLNTAWMQCSKSYYDLLQKDGDLRVG